MSLALDSRIVIDKKIKGGKPCLAGHRIAVQDIVIWHERQGMAIDSIASDFDLSLTDIYIALAFYYANRESIDRTIREDELLAESLKKTTPSRLQKKLASLGNN
jgi:uncharacterized protein (DUF433 family)